MDRFISERINSELSQNAHFKIVDIDYSYGDLIKVYKGSLQMFSNLSYIKEDLQDMFAKNDLDAMILVIERRHIANHYWVNGFGVVMENPTTCFTHLFAWAWLIKRTHLEQITSFGLMAHQRLKPVYCPDGDLSLTSEQQEFVINWAKNELQADIHNGLLRIGLIK